MRSHEGVGKRLMSIDSHAKKSSLQFFFPIANQQTRENRLQMEDDKNEDEKHLILFVYLIEN